MNLPFLKEEQFGLRTQVTFTGNKLEIYIPSYYLADDSGMGSVAGEYIETMGVFWFKCEDKWYDLALPLKFLFGYSDHRKFTGKLKPELPNIEYDVFTLEKGDAFCYDTNHLENVSDIMYFMNKMLEGGKIPPLISYNDVLSFLLTALSVTKSGGLGVSAVTYELLISELYRSKRNTSVPFRKEINIHPENAYDYKMVKVTKIPELTSTMTGLMGEDSTQQIVAAVLHNRENRVEKISPVEKLIKY